MSGSSSCTCSSSRLLQASAGEASSQDPLHHSSSMPLVPSHPNNMMAKEGDYEHVGTFHYKKQDHHHHHHHHHHDDCVAECDQSSECEGVCTSRSSCCDFSSSGSQQTVVKAYLVHDTQQSEGLPAVQLSAAAAIVDVPALRLSLLERSGTLSSTATSSSNNTIQNADHLEAECSVASYDSGASSSSSVEAAGCVPVVIATPLEEPTVHTTTSSCMYETGNAWNRPQFLSATVVRESTDQKFGIKFHCVDPNKNNYLSSWNYSQRLFRRRRGSQKKQHPNLVQNEFPRISEVHKNSNGLLSQAPFCVGDQLISINKESCRGMPPAVFAERLATLQGVITFVVQHPGGDSTLVESFLCKPTPTSKTGVGLVYSPRHNRLRVKHVHFAGLMVEGLLQVEDRIVAINHIPCQHWDAQTAADQIALSPFWVSIVARRHRDAAVVLTVSESSEQEPGLSGLSSKDSVRSLIRSLNNHPSSHGGENVCHSPRSSSSSSRGLGFLSRRRRTRRLRHAVSF